MSRSRFVLSECAIPSVWCGKGKLPKRKLTDETYYYKTGDRYECMKKGFGAGTHSERKKGLPANSLQQIKYVGDVYEEKFKAVGITTLSSLRSHMESKNSKQIETFLTKIFTKKGGTLDQRAYNSTLVYLYKNGHGSKEYGSKDLPKCSKIRV